jgi:DNA adenine methylase
MTNMLSEMSLASPITWFGAKSSLVSKILEHIPSHLAYCEPFGGSAAVLLAKAPAEVEVYNDIDGELVNFFRVLRDPILFTRLSRAAEHTLYSRAEFELAKLKSDDPVEAARRFIVRERQSWGSLGRDWSYCVEGSRSGMAAVVKRWKRGIDRLPAVHRRMQTVQIECDHWWSVMRRFDSPQTLHYLDPPYHPDTRVHGGYRHEFTEEEHRELVARLLSVQGMVVLSGYDHETYAPLEGAGWKRATYDVPSNMSGRRTRRVESLWLSPSVGGRAANRKVFLTPIERKRLGAYQSHRVQVAGSTKRVLRAMENLRARGRRVTKASVARVARMSREHVSRKYGHLFGA